MSKLLDALKRAEQLRKQKLAQEAEVQAARSRDGDSTGQSEIEAALLAEEARMAAQRVHALYEAEKKKQNNVDHRPQVSTNPAATGNGGEGAAAGSNPAVTTLVPSLTEASRLRLAGETQTAKSDVDRREAEARLGKEAAASVAAQPVFPPSQSRVADAHDAVVSAKRRRVGASAMADEESQRRSRLEQEAADTLSARLAEESALGALEVARADAERIAANATQKRITREEDARLAIAERKKLEEKAQRAAEMAQAAEDESTRVAEATARTEAERANKYQLTIADAEKRRLNALAQLEVLRRKEEDALRAFERHQAATEQEVAAAIASRQSAERKAADAAKKRESVASQQSKLLEKIHQRENELKQEAKELLEQEQQALADLEQQIVAAQTALAASTTSRRQSLGADGTTFEAEKARLEAKLAMILDARKQPDAVTPSGDENEELLTLERRINLEREQLDLINRNALEVANTARGRKDAATADAKQRFDALAHERAIAESRLREDARRVQANEEEAIAALKAAAANDALADNKSMESLKATNAKLLQRLQAQRSVIADAAAAAKRERDALEQALTDQANNSRKALDEIAAEEARLAADVKEAEILAAAAQTDLNLKIAERRQAAELANAAHRHRLQIEEALTAETQKRTNEELALVQVERARERTESQAAKAIEARVASERAPAISTSEKTAAEEQRREAQAATATTSRSAEPMPVTRNAPQVRPRFGWPKATAFATLVAASFYLGTAYRSGLGLGPVSALSPPLTQMTPSTATHLAEPLALKLDRTLKTPKQPTR